MTVCGRSELKKKEKTWWARGDRGRGATRCTWWPPGSAASRPSSRPSSPLSPGWPLWSSSAWSSTTMRTSSSPPRPPTLLESASLSTSSSRSELVLVCFLLFFGALFLPSFFYQLIIVSVGKFDLLYFFFLSIKLFYHLMGNSFIRSWCIFRVVYALRKLSSVKELNVNWQSYSMPQLYGFWNNEFQKIDNNKLITQACEWLAIFFTESCTSDHPALIWTFIHLREMVPVSSLVSSGYWLINSCLHDCIQ